MTAPAPDYRIEIGELSIEGFDAAPAAIGAAVRRELGLMLADPAGPFAIAPRTGATMTLALVEHRGPLLARDASPRAIGRAAASAIAARLTAPARRDGR